jgi:hypothetical protein
MTWNANIPATNAALLSAPLRENFQALDTSFYAPLTAATDGYLLYRAAGPTVSGESNLLWDATNNNLKLFGGGVGTSGQGVLALGPSMAPTTSPVDTVQLWTEDLSADPGSRGLVIRDERGGKLSFSSLAGGTYLRMTSPSGVLLNIDTYSSTLRIGSSSNHVVHFVVNDAPQMTLNSSGRLDLVTGEGLYIGVNDDIQFFSVGGASFDTEIIMNASGGHAYRLNAGGTGSSFFGVGAWALYDVTAAKTRLKWVASGDCYLGISNLEARVVYHGAIDSGGAGWRQLVIQN